jgi:hypothetical protein
MGRFSEPFSSASAKGVVDLENARRWLVRVFLCNRITFDIQITLS